MSTKSRNTPHPLLRKMATFFRNEPKLGNICFKCGQYVLNEKVWRQALPAMLESGKQSVVFRTLPPGYGAQYNPNTKTFIFPQGFSLGSFFEKQDALHESVHAYNEAGTYGLQSSWLDELAAYIADACYKELNLKRWPATNPDAIRSSASVIARKVLANNSGMYIVTAADGKTVLSAFKKSRLYKQPDMWNDRR